MTPPLSYRKLINIVLTLKKEGKTLTMPELMQIMEHLKDISTDKSTIDIMLSSLKTLQHQKLYGKQQLTNREMEVLLKIANGLQNMEIASRLNLSKATIETHRKNIRKKLKLKSKDSLFAFAMVFSLQHAFEHKTVLN